MPHWGWACPTEWVELPIDVKIKTTVEAGINKTRPRYTRELINIEAGWMLRDFPRDVGYLQIYSFWKVDCAKGAYHFSMYHPWVENSPRMYRWTTPPKFESIANKLIAVRASLEQTMPWVP